MEDVVITWSFENWLTVILMVAVGFLVLSIAAQLVRRARGAGQSSNA